MSSTSISAAHTRGPWQVLAEECDKPYIRVRGTVLGGRYKIANILTPVYEGVHEREAAETRANARLIAAAPELLESLRMLTAALPVNRDWLDPDIERFAKSTIARATGVQP